MVRSKEKEDCFSPCDCHMICDKLLVGFKVKVTRWIQSKAARPIATAMARMLRLGI